MFLHYCSCFINCSSCFLIFLHVSSFFHSSFSSFSSFYTENRRDFAWKSSKISNVHLFFSCCHSFQYFAFLFSFLFFHFSNFFVFFSLHFFLCFFFSSLFLFFLIFQFCPFFCFPFFLFSIFISFIFSFHRVLFFLFPLFFFIFFFFFQSSEQTPKPEKSRRTVPIDFWVSVGRGLKGHESMIQLPRMGWRLLACQNGASPDWIIDVVVLDAALMRWNVYGHKLTTTMQVTETNVHVPSHLGVKSPGPGDPAPPPALDDEEL